MGAPRMLCRLGACACVACAARGGGRQGVDAVLQGVWQVCELLGEEEEIRVAPGDERRRRAG
jgi:hypothetical protein